MSQHQKSDSPLYFPHKKKYLLEFSPMISFCGNCSSAIIGKTKSTIKPLKYHTKWENFSFTFLNKSNMNKTSKYGKHLLMFLIVYQLLLQLMIKYY